MAGRNERAGALNCLEQNDKLLTEKREIPTIQIMMRLSNNNGRADGLQRMCEQNSSLSSRSNH